MTHGEGHHIRFFAVVGDQGERFAFIGHDEVSQVNSG
jgi:hypothetical protein